MDDYWGYSSRTLVRIKEVGVPALILCLTKSIFLIVPLLLLITPAIAHGVNWMWNTPNLANDEDCENSQPNGLVGCPLDHMSHVGGFPDVVGTWNFVNASTDTSNATAMTGTMTFDKNGSLNILLPRTPLINASWGSNGHKLAECFFAACTTLTFTKISHDHIKMLDENGNTIHLMCQGDYVSVDIKIGKNTEQRIII